MNTHLQSLAIWSAIVALLVSTLGKAASISVQAGDPQLSGVVSSIWRTPAGDVVHDLEMPAHANMTSSDMAVVTFQNLVSIPGVDPASTAVAGNTVNVHSTPLFDPLDGVQPGGSIYWSTGTTAQESMRLSSPGTTRATIAGTGFFNPFYQPGQPANFTAGIVTDAGVLSAKVSASELNFQTDGPIICQALFQRLAPRAPQYGAQINYAGDRLEVYFDPAYTVTQGGIIFGTTSPSQGYSGTIILPPTPPIELPGDFNADGIVDSADSVLLRLLFGTTSSMHNDPIGGTIGSAQYDLWRSHYGSSSVLGGSAVDIGSSISVPEPTVLMLVLWLAGAAFLQRLSRVT